MLIKKYFKFLFKFYIINVFVNGYIGMNLQVIDNGIYKDYYEVKVIIWFKFFMKL